MQIVRWIIVAIVFLALLFLSLQNAVPVTLRVFNLASLEAPLVFVVFVVFAAGVAAGLLAGAMRASRLKRQLNRLRREHHRGERRDTSLPSGVVPGQGPAPDPGYPRADRLSDGR